MDDFKVEYRIVEIFDRFFIQKRFFNITEPENSSKWGCINHCDEYNAIGNAINHPMWEDGLSQRFFHDFLAKIIPQWHFFGTIEEAKAKIAQLIKPPIYKTFEI